MGTATHVCRDDRPAIRRHHRELRALLKVELSLALAHGPATTGELRQRCGSHRMWATNYWDCCRQLADEPWTVQWAAVEIQQELVRREKRGEAARLIMPGVQSHLWWAL